MTIGPTCTFTCISQFSPPLSKKYTLLSSHPDIVNGSIHSYPGIANGSTTSVHY